MNPSIAHAVLRYSTVQHNFIIECDVCIGKISVFINHGFIENDHFTNAAAVVLGFNNLYFITKINGHIL